MNENEIKNNNTDSQEDKDIENTAPKDEYYDNPYAKFIYSEEDEEDPDTGSIILPLIDEAAHKQHFSRIGLGFALFSLISFAVSIIIQKIVLTVNSDLYSSILFRNLVTPISLYLFALPVLMIFLSKCDAKAPEKKRMGFWRFILFVIVAFGFMYIGSLTGNFLMELLSVLAKYNYGNALESIIDVDNIWITALFTVVIAPICEEFVFRKLLIDRTHKYGAFISIGLSGLTFGLMHGNFYQFFYAFALGLLLGYVYLSTGKLYLSVAIHAIVNFAGSVISPLLMSFSEDLASIDPNDTEAMMTFIEENLIPYLLTSALGSFYLAAMACAVIFPIVFRKKLKLSPSELTIPRGRVVPIVILNGGIMAMLIIYLLEFGLSLLPI